MTRKCPTCGGDGIIVSEGTAAAEVERSLRRLVTPGRAPRPSRSSSTPRSRRARRPGGDPAARARGGHQAPLFLRRRPRRLARPPARARAGHGRDARNQPSPFAVGDEVDVRLGEVGLHDAHAGVGKLDGFDIVVAEASKLVGKRVRTRIVAVMDGVAYGVQLEQENPDGARSPPRPRPSVRTRARRPTRRRPPRIGGRRRRARARRRG